MFMTARSIGNRSRTAHMTPMALACLIGAFGIALSISAALSFGAVGIPIDAVWRILGNKLLSANFDATWSKGWESIVWDIRFPRALLACLVGAGLSIVGASLQSVTRNPLSDPHLLGISSGAAFGAILVLIHTGLFIGLFTVPLMAFCGSAVAMLIVVGLCSFSSALSADRLVLVGVAVSFVIMAGANMLIFLGDPRASHTVIFWMLGGLGLAQWDHLIFPASVLLFGGAYLLAKANDLNAMTVGDETASTLGIPVSRFRLTVFMVASLITGVMVAFSGIIGFVGLMIPHIVRQLIGGDNFRVLPLSALLGAIFLTWADILARMLMQPADLPIGILTGFLGGMFFIWLVRKRRL